MITDQDYTILADESYFVDKKKTDNPHREGRTITNENLSRDYKILKAEDIIYQLICVKSKKLM